MGDVFAMGIFIVMTMNIPIMVKTQYKNFRHSKMAIENFYEVIHAALALPYISLS
jgi:hypothetical protein